MTKGCSHELQQTYSPTSTTWASVSVLIEKKSAAVVTES